MQRNERSNRSCRIKFLKGDKVMENVMTNDEKVSALVSEPKIRKTLKGDEK